jgi:hypothetical protein
MRPVSICPRRTRARLKAVVGTLLGLEQQQGAHHHDHLSARDAPVPTTMIIWRRGGGNARVTVWGMGEEK